MGDSNAPSSDTGEAIDRILSDWQNWSATKLSETEMARLAYDVQELIRGERFNTAVSIRKAFPTGSDAELTVLRWIEANAATLSSGQTDGHA